LTEERQDLRPIALALLALVLYLVTSPGTLNADGLGYLKLLPHNFAAGHLLYMPLLRFATTHLGGDGLRIGRLLDAILGATGVLLTYGIARRAAPLRSDRTFVATVAACGTALSYGYWIESCDVEAYALATVALLALVRVALPYPAQPGVARALLIGLCLAGCVLTHLSHVLASFFVVAVCVRDARGTRHGIVAAVIALVVGGTLSLGAYAYAAFVVRGHHLEGAVRWVGSAQHGFSEQSGPYAIGAAIYGLCRTFIWSPYLYEADAPRLIGQLLLGLALLVVFSVAIFARRSAVAALPLRSFAILAAPYVLLAILFFGADPERWIFILPLLWIVVAVALDASTRGRQIAVVAIVTMGALNFALAIWPAHKDTWVRHQAELAASALHDGDLLIFPGHSWDEYVSFYGGRAVEPFPLAYYAARDGHPRMWERLDREVDAARARGHQVFAVRLFDEAREVADDPAGYTELRSVGLSRGVLRAELTRRFAVVPLAELAGRDGVTVVRLDPVQPK
jgi:hypothetical protein